MVNPNKHVTQPTRKDIHRIILAHPLHTDLEYIMPSKNAEHEADEVLQAVILADSFNKRFKPLTIDRPKV